MEQSRHCERLTRERAPEFYLASLMWPKQIREDAWAIFAVARTVRDAVEFTDRLAAARLLADWRQKLRNRQPGTDPMAAEALRVISAHDIPLAYPLDFLDGCKAELQFKQPQGLQDLYRICYRNSGTLAVMMSYLLGASGSGLKAAEKLGVAIHLTDIARSTSVDSARGHIYLPSRLLQEVGACSEDFSQLPLEMPAKLAIAQLIRQAKGYFVEAERGISTLAPGLRRPAEMIKGLYEDLLTKLERADFQAGDGLRLSWPEKLLSMGRRLF